MGWSFPVKRRPYLIQHLQNSGTAYRYMYSHPWTTIALIRCMVQSVCSRKQLNTWACLDYSWMSCCGLWGDLSLSDVVHTSYNTHKIVGLDIHTCGIILGPLHDGWGAWFKLLVILSRETVERVWGVVGCHAVVFEAIHLCYTWSMPQITLQKKVR